MDELTQIAQDELDADEGTALASVEEVQAELEIDHITSIMAEPAGPLKRFPRGRPRSGLPSDGTAADGPGGWG